MSKSNYDINTHTTTQNNAAQYHSSVEEKIMARTKSDNVQINISIPTGWKQNLKILLVSILLKKENYHFS